jgi:hypothetical protein
MSRAREVSKVISTVENLDAVAYSSASPSGAEVGDLWVDTSTANPLIKAYDGTEWDTLGSTPVPIITGIAPDNISGSASTVVIINGTNFESGSIVKLIDINSTELFTLSTTFNNARSLQFLTPALTASAGPYDIKVTNPDNQLSILENALSVGQAPNWITASGSLGSIFDTGRSSTTFQLSAIDPDSQTVTYSISSGSLPTNMTMSSSGLISGTTQAVASDTTYAFTVRASDSLGNFTDRSYSITVKAPVVQSFTSVGTTSWTSPVSGNIRVLVVAGGGSGSTGNNGNDGGGGGGAGGYIHNTSFSVTANQSYTVTVGSGGSRPSQSFNVVGNDGSNSVFASLNAVGGGGAGQCNLRGRNGGSGGGDGGGGVTANGGGIATSGQGFNGGTNIGSPSYTGAGGGGAGGIGSNGGGNLRGHGGAGLSNDITGTSTFYAGGGGGGSGIGSTDTQQGNGGSGIGGNGGNLRQVTTAGGGGDGINNTGSGGGGAGHFSNYAGTGGSGVVILRY